MKGILIGALVGFGLGVAVTLVVTGADAGRAVGATDVGELRGTPLFTGTSSSGPSRPAAGETPEGGTDPAREDVALAPEDGGAETGTSASEPGATAGDGSATGAPANGAAAADSDVVGGTNGAGGTNGNLDAAAAGAGAGAADHDKPLPDIEGLVTWEDIAFFDYELPDPREPDDETPLEEQIPEEVKKLSGTEIVIEGHMLPLKVEDGRVHSFILSRYFAGCCFGGVPMMNEWVEVEMVPEDGAEYLPFSTVLVKGKFEVGEVFDEYGYVSSVYRMSGESVEER